MTITRLLLARRRLDTGLLAGGFACAGVLDLASKLVFLFFITAGVYLVLRLHRSVRFAPPAVSIALLAFGLWPIVLGLSRGEPIENNRQWVYSLIAVAFVFFPVGLGLVQRPLAAAVSGARFGAFVLTVLAVGDFAWNGGRVGLGGNEAIFAYMVALAGILSRVEIRSLPRFVPGGLACFYLSAIPVVLSQTRAAWFVYLVAALLDVPKLVSGWRRQARRFNLFLFAALGIACLAIVPGARIVSSGFEIGMEQFSDYSPSKSTETSVGIRMAMWEGAVAVLQDHPILGVGASRRVEAVAERMPESRSTLSEFRHLHNLFLDEALSNGLIGVALMLSVFATFILAAWKTTTDLSTLQTSALLVLLIVSFGQFHGVMLNETMLMTSFAAFMTILVGAPKERERTRAKAEARPGSPAGQGL